MVQLKSERAFECKHEAESFSPPPAPRRFRKLPSSFLENLRKEKKK